MLDNLTYPSMVLVPLVICILLCKQKIKKTSKEDLHRSSHDKNKDKGGVSSTGEPSKPTTSSAPKDPKPLTIKSNKLQPESNEHNSLPKEETVLNKPTVIEPKVKEEVRVDENVDIKLEPSKERLKHKIDCSKADAKLNGGSAKSGADSDSSSIDGQPLEELNNVDNKQKVKESSKKEISRKPSEHTQKSKSVEKSLPLSGKKELPEIQHYVPVERRVLEQVKTGKDPNKPAKGYQLIKRPVKPKKSVKQQLQ